jgi:hypothetical protein
MLDTSTRYPDLGADQSHKSERVAASNLPQRLFPVSDLEASAQISPMNNFEILVKALRDRLGPCSGINDDDVDPEELQSLMRVYLSKEPEWEQYAFKVPSKPYTRNLVDKGNGKSNLVGLAFGCLRIAYM